VQFNSLPTHNPCTQSPELAKDTFRNQLWKELNDLGEDMTICHNQVYQYFYGGFVNRSEEIEAGTTATSLSPQ